MNNPLTPVEALQRLIDEAKGVTQSPAVSTIYPQVYLAALELAKEVNAYRATMQPEVLIKLHELLEVLE